MVVVRRSKEVEKTRGETGRRKRTRSLVYHPVVTMKGEGNKEKDSLSLAHAVGDGEGGKRKKGGGTSIAT